MKISENASPARVILEQRKKLGMIQEDVAAKINVSVSTWSRIESGARIPVDDEADKIAALLKIDPQYLRALCDLARREKYGNKPTAVVVKQDYVTNHIHVYDEHYIGELWTQLTPNPVFGKGTVEFSIRWGAWKFEGSVVVREDETITLFHTKSTVSQAPLFLNVSPPCRVEFNTGAPPIEDYININFGWRRVEPFAWNIFWCNLRFAAKQIVRVVRRP